MLTKEIWNSLNFKTKTSTIKYHLIKDNYKTLELENVSKGKLRTKYDAIEHHHSRFYTVNNIIDNEATCIR